MGAGGKVGPAGIWEELELWRKNKPRFWGSHRDLHHQGLTASLGWAGLGCGRERDHVPSQNPQISSQNPTVSSRGCSARPGHGCGVVQPLGAGNPPGFRGSPGRSGGVSLPLPRSGGTSGAHERPGPLPDRLLLPGRHRLRHRHRDHRLQQVAGAEPETFLLTREFLGWPILGLCRPHPDSHPSQGVRDRPSW